MEEERVYLASANAYASSPPKKFLLIRHVQKTNHASILSSSFLYRDTIMPITHPSSIVDIQYSMTDIQDEVRALVERGLVGKQARIYELKKFFSDRKWQTIERLLDMHDYVLRGHIIDLVGKESWIND
jgi:hypothetical protein